MSPQPSLAFLPIQKTYELEKKEKNENEETKIECDEDKPLVENSCYKHVPVAILTILLSSNGLNSPKIISPENILSRKNFGAAGSFHLTCIGHTKARAERLIMASLNFFVTPMVSTRRRVFTAATAAKSSGGSKEEKGLLDFILGGLLKQDQLLETDPVLKKVEDKNGGRKNSVAVPPPPQPLPKKKEGGFGFGDFFAKNEK